MSCRHRALVSRGPLLRALAPRLPAGTPCADASQRDALVTVSSWRASKPPVTSSCFVVGARAKEMASSGPGRRTTPALILGIFVCCEVENQFLAQVSSSRHSF